METAAGNQCDVRRFRAAEALIRALDKHGIHIVHLWGMTETSPLATTCRVRSHMADWTEDQQYKVVSRQGSSSPFVELRVTRDGREVPRDAQTVGDLEVRGPWVSSSYYNAPEEQKPMPTDGRMGSGPATVATMDPKTGYIKLVGSQQRFKLNPAANGSVSCICAWKT